jgi:hypothetical protein
MTFGVEEDSEEEEGGFSDLFNTRIQKHQFIFIYMLYMNTEAFIHHHNSSEKRRERILQLDE